MTGLLPAWVPTDALLIAVVVFFIAMLVMNRGVPFFVNLLAQDEPLLIAIGAFLILGAGWFARTLGLGFEPVWMAGGLLAIMVGLAARYTDMLDVSGLI